MQPISPKSPNVAPPEAPGMGPDDILFTLFRHKQLILAGLILGIIGAGVVKVIYRPFWATEAKLNIPYIKETLPSDPSEPTARVRATDVTGQTIIGTEMEILKSIDVASNAAYIVGP